MPMVGVGVLLVALGALISPLVSAKALFRDPQHQHEHALNPEPETLNSNRPQQSKSASLLALKEDLQIGIPGFVPYCDGHLLPTGKMEKSAEGVDRGYGRFNAFLHLPMQNNGKGGAQVTEGTFVIHIRPKFTFDKGISADDAREFIHAFTNQVDNKWDSKYKFRIEYPDTGAIINALVRVVVDSDPTSTIWEETGLVNKEYNKVILGTRVMPRVPIWFGPFQIDHADLLPLTVTHEIEVRKPKTGAYVSTTQYTNPSEGEFEGCKVIQRVSYCLFQVKELLPPSSGERMTAGTTCGGVDGDPFYTLPHEFGHMMGLHDEYNPIPAGVPFEELLRDANILDDPHLDARWASGADKRVQPSDNAVGCNIMAWGSKVRKFHLATFFQAFHELLLKVELDDPDMIKSIVAV